MRKSQKGFTLIELLVVITVIGILAAVLITVIDPARQQARARNGTISATVSKIAFAMNAAIAADGALPGITPDGTGGFIASPTDFESEVNNSTNITCAYADPYLLCTFEISGVNLPVERGGGGQDLFYFATSDWNVEDKGHFQVVGNMHQVGNNSDLYEAYIFDSLNGMYECSKTGSVITMPSTTSLITDFTAEGCSLIEN